MRKWVSVAVAAGLFVGGVGGAVAASWHRLNMETNGAKFVGDYAWEPKETNHGAFHFRGMLRDDEAGDGHNVYIQAKVQGYGWSRFNGTQRKDVYVDKLVYDGAARYSTDAEIRVCRDRGSLRPDNCSPTRVFTR
ncbi:hypothetical protein ACIGEZ_31510 [Streptomyces sp. NPDC085481]|uniref:hypothetical protein n=1 Tax=Streptomyces sp. NPDC085481 TaxID=3365727 RepID=UPI0037CF7CAA